MSAWGDREERKRSCAEGVEGGGGECYEKMGVERGNEEVMSRWGQREGGKVMNRWGRGR